MRIWNDLLYLFFPRLCLLCRRPLVEGEEHICLHCAEDLPYTYYIDVHANPVYRLFKERFPIEAATAFLFFKQGGSAQTLIHALKYDGNRQLGYHLGRMAALEYRESGLFDAVDCLLPVPLHPKRERKRGYNQSEWIARGVQSVTGLPIDRTSLVRERKNESQTHKSLSERQQNVAHIFRVQDADVLSGKHVLLLDDVITTGSTLGACIEALQEVPGIRISVLGMTVA